MDKKILPFGYIEDHQLFRNGLNNGEPVSLKKLENEEESQAILFFEEQYAKLLSEFTRVENRILGTENKGSFRAKLENLKNQLATHQGLGDYDFIAKKINLYENQIEDIIKANRKKNTDIKNALLIELDIAVNNPDMHEAGETIKDIRKRWVKTGNADDSVNQSLEERFSTLSRSFYDKRQSFYDDKKRLLDSKIKKYDNLVSELESLIQDGKFTKSVDRVKNIQLEWKEVGHIPEKEFKSRNKRYWELCKQFFDELKKARKDSGNKIDFKGNLKKKEVILEQLKTLEQKSMQQDCSDQVDSVKANWKKIGYISKPNIAQTNDDYYALLDSIAERSFIFQLAVRRNKGFAKMAENDRKNILTRLTRELLSRDKAELANFQENMNNMHVSKGTFLDMLDKKLKLQEKRVQAKQNILSELRVTNKPMNIDEK